MPLLYVSKKGSGLTVDEGRRRNWCTLLQDRTHTHTQRLLPTYKHTRNIRIQAGFAMCVPRWDSTQCCYSSRANLRYSFRRSWTDDMQLHVIAPLATAILVIFTNTPSKQEVVGQFWWCVCEETAVKVVRGERWREREESSHHVMVGIFLKVGVDQTQIET